MTWVLGVALGCGLWLVLSPWLWPKREKLTGDHLVRSESRLRRLLAEAGSTLSPVAFTILCVGVALVGAIVTLGVTRNPALGLLAAVGCGGAGLVILRARRARRIEARRALWPDVCDLLVASVRSGMSLPDALASLESSAPVPLRTAFAAFRSDLSASAHFDTSLTTLKTRLADATADRIIETLRMARQVGGTQLPTVLRGLSRSVRAEVAVRGEVNARQSWIRGAAVVGVIAPWVILGMLLLRPEGASAYATPGGMLLLVVAAAVSVVAYRIMMRIGRLPQPKRWFS